MINREELIDQHEEFSLWWQLPEQEGLRKSCAAGWAFRVWQASREAIDIVMPPSVITTEIGPAISHEKMIARLAVNGIKVKS